MKRLAIATLLAMVVLLPTRAQAEEKPPLFYMDNADKKVNVQELGLSPTTTLYEVFQLFPELLQSSSGGLLDGYGVTVDGQDVGSNKHITVRQMTLGEVKSISITENASASYARNGNTGVVEIETQEINEGVCGSAAGSVSTETSGLASCNVNYRKGSLSVKTALRLDYYRHDGDRQMEDQLDGSKFSMNDIYYRDQNFNEMAKIALQWNPTHWDELKVRLWQSYSSKQAYNENEMHRLVNNETPQIWNFGQLEVDSTNYAHSFTSFLQYKHAFGSRHNLKIEASYNYSGNGFDSKNYYYIGGVDSLLSSSIKESHPHAINGKMEYEAITYQALKHELKLKLGVNTSYSTGKESSRYESYDIVGRDTFMNSSSDSRYSVSPFAELNYHFGTFLSFRAGANYQYVSLCKDDDRAAYHLYNTNVCLTAQPAKGHSVRATYARNELDVMLDQRRGHTHSASLAYIYDGRLGEHLLNSELAFFYTRVHDMGTNYNVWSPRLSMYYQYRWFALSFGFNLFENSWLRQDENLDYVGYYNIRLNPIFRLPREWQISATVVYNSSRITLETATPRYVFTSVHLNKTIGKWDLHLSFNDLLHYRSTAISNRYEVDGHSFETHTSSYYYPRYAMLGVAYHF